MTNFVLVHGAYHGAWCWFKVTAELEARGHTVATFDLPGHGVDTTPVRGVTFDGYVNSVLDVVDGIDGPIVLVGHSMSGMIITQVAERRPDAIDALVYLTAYLPADGESMMDQRVEGSLISRNFTVDEERGVGIVSRGALQELFYADCSPSDLALATSLVRPEPFEPLSRAVSITEERFGSVPRTFVVCEHDRTISPTHQRTMIEERGCDEVMALEASHSPFLSIPEELAATLESVV